MAPFPPTTRPASLPLRHCYNEVFQELDLNTSINLPSIKEPERQTYPSTGLKSIAIQPLKDFGRFGEFTVTRAASPLQSIVVFSGSASKNVGLYMMGKAFISLRKGDASPAETAIASDGHRLVSRRRRARYLGAPTLTKQPSK
jgi:hypothetical protein